MQEKKFLTQSLCEHFILLPRLIVQMCWNTEPRNRPSFKNIIMHLDIAAVEILCKTPEDYFQRQVKRWLD